VLSGLWQHRLGVGHKGEAVSKFVPNKKTYVKRLKAMLKTIAPCECCPCRRIYAYRYVDNYEHCQMCQDFVDLRHIHQYESENACPCQRIGKKKAITRALAAIEAYEAGEHKWCKE